MHQSTAYICVADLQERVSYFVWISRDNTNEADGVLTDDRSLIPAFASEAEARAFVATTEFVLAGDTPIRYNLAAVFAWCDQPTNPPDSQLLLDAWNLFTDLPPSRSGADLFAHIERSNNDLYEKLFWANNLPSVTPPGERYEPVWSESEVAQLATVIRLGASRFVARLARAAA